MKTQWKKLNIIYAFTILILLTGSFTVKAASQNTNANINKQPVQVYTDGLNACLSNGIISINFNERGSAISLIKDGVDLLKNVKENTFYLSDNIDGKFGGLSPSELKVIKKSDDLVEIAYISDNNPLYFELHYIMKRGDSGLYSFLVAKNNKHPISLSELRTVYRMDRNIFDNAYNAERQGGIPLGKNLATYPLVQDTTWQLPDGSIWSKYDWASYQIDDHVHGHFGHNFGFWVIPVSREYYNGGPMKQELMVHHDALSLQMLYGSHFGAGSLNIPTGWEKLYGPWFLYINSGSNNELIQDAKSKAAIEEGKYPYQWMSNDLYPTARATVTGKLKVINGSLAGGAMVTLAKPGKDLMTQGLDYIFYAKTTTDGRFEIPAVRPGNYTFYAYATGGKITDQLEVADITVGNTDINLGTINWVQPSNRTFIWQIGSSDRKSSEFKLGNLPRQFGLTYKVPANLTYTVGTSKDAENWYYAQTIPGDWNVNFNFANSSSQDGYGILTVAIASVARGPFVNVLVNGKNVGSLDYHQYNDSSTYRCTNSAGHYRLQEIKFPLSLLNAGPNTITFRLASVGDRGGIMYDTIKFETSDMAK